MIITTTAQKVQMYRFLSKMPISPKTNPKKCRRKLSWKIDSNSKASKLLSSLQFASCLDSTVTFSALSVDRPVLPRIYTLGTRYELFIYSLVIFGTSFVRSMKPIENTVASIIASIELVMIVMKLCSKEIR